MKRTLAILACLVVCAGLLPVHAYAQGGVQPGDPIFGTWILDKAKSLYFGRAEPERQTRIYEPHPDGIKATIITVFPDGREIQSQFVSAHDGVPSPFNGAEQFDEITLERRGPYEAFVTLTNGAVDLGNAWRSISADGKVMTVRVQLRGNLSSIAVYNKKED